MTTKLSRLICKFRSAKNRFERSIVGRGILLVTSLQNRANQCIDVVSERKKYRYGAGGELWASERKRQRNRAGGEQLKDFTDYMCQEKKEEN